MWPWPRLRLGYLSVPELNHGWRGWLDLVTIKSVAYLFLMDFTHVAAAMKCLIHAISVQGRESNHHLSCVYYYFVVLSICLAS